MELFCGLFKTLAIAADYVFDRIRELLNRKCIVVFVERRWEQVYWTSIFFIVLCITAFFGVLAGIAINLLAILVVANVKVSILSTTYIGMAIGTVLFILSLVARKGEIKSGQGAV